MSGAPLRPLPLGSLPLGSLLLGSLLLGSLCAPAPGAPDRPREVYFGELRKEDARLARTWRQALAALRADPPRAHEALRVLLAAAAAPSGASWLVEAEAAGEGAREGVLARVERRRSLRAALLAELQRLDPAARSALAQEQQAAAELALRSQAPPDALGLLRRFPLSQAGADGLRQLWGLACEAGDRQARVELTRWVRACHPDLQLPAPPAPQPASSALQPGSSAPQPGSSAPQPGSSAESPAPDSSQPGSSGAGSSGAGSSGAGSSGAGSSGAGELTLLASHALEPGGRLGAPFSPCQPRLVAGRVVVADGGRVHVFSPRGEPQGALPLLSKAASAGPDRSASYVGRIASANGVAFVPLLLPGPLAPARDSLRRDDSFAGRYHSLVALDPLSCRALWWDGDPGPRGAGPPGFGERPELIDPLRRAHALACAAGPRRVYLAYTQPGRDSSLSVMAFERRGGRQALELVPAWERPTYLFTAERQEGDAADLLIAPEISVALVLDPEAGLLLTSDVGVVAALSPWDGSVRWLDELTPGNMHQETPAQPAFLAEGGLFALAEGQLYQLDPQAGVPRWSQPVGATTRLLAWPGAAVTAYGRRRAFGLDAEQGQTLFRRFIRSRDDFSCVGRIARRGHHLFVPRWRRGPGGRLEVVDVGAEGKGWRTIQTLEAPKIEGPFNVELLPEGLVAAAARRVAFFGWER